MLAALFGVFGRRSVTRASREQGRAEAQAQAAQADLAQRNERERLASAVPTVLLEGVDAQRQPIALRVPARAIAAEGGAVVGRNPHESTLVLDHAEVSRRHFRLSAQGASVLIEDLNSTNGTVLNEAPLVPNNTSALEDGALVQVGSLTLTVTLRA